MTMFEPLDIDYGYEHNETISEDDRQKVLDLYALAKTNGHRVALISNSLDKYCPSFAALPPLVYDLERYGTETFDREAVLGDFKISKWIGIDGNEEIVSQTVAEAGARWYNDLPVPMVEEDGVLGEDMSAIPDPERWDIIQKTADDHWKSQLAGTPFGELWELIESQSEDFHCNEAFTVATFFFDETDFSVDEIKKWVAADCIYDEAQMLFNAGFTPEEVGTPYLDTGMNLKQKYFADDEWTYETIAEYLRLADGDTNLDDVFTLEEAAEKWGIDKWELNRKFSYEEHVSTRLQRQKRVRKSGETLLIHKKAMIELFGEPSAPNKKTPLWGLFVWGRLS